MAGSNVLGDDAVWVVAYGDSGVHVYPNGQEDTARAVYTVGVAAFGDGADIHRFSARTWARIRAHLTGVTIHVHGDS